MKKFMMAVVIAALAFGAQAGDVAYSFKLSLENISSGGAAGGGDSTLYFINTSTKEIYAYFKRSEIHQDSDTVWSGEKLTRSASVVLSYDGDEYTGGNQDLTSAKITKNVHSEDASLANAVYEMSFSSSGSLAKYDGEYGPVPELAAVLVFDGGPTLAYDGFKSMSTGSSMVDYQASYIKPVPEPTSAMLLLLGMAGFALKRKVA